MKVTIIRVIQYISKRILWMHKNHINIRFNDIALCVDTS